MFIEDFIDVDLGFSVVGPQLLGDAGRFLGPCAERAEHAGAEVVVRVGPGGVLGPARQRVRVDTGPPRRRGDGVVVPVEWETIRLQGLFPKLEADLEVAPLGDDRCRLTLSGQYNPPFGQVGASLDRRVLHWVAESTVRAFLADLAEALAARHGVGGPDGTLASDDAPAAGSGDVAVFGDGGASE